MDDYEDDGDDDLNAIDLKNHRRNIGISMRDIITVVLDCGLGDGGDDYETRVRLHV